MMARGVVTILVFVPWVGFAQEDTCNAKLSVAQTHATLGPFGTLFQYEVLAEVGTSACVELTFDVMRSYRQKDGTVFSAGVPTTMVVRDGRGSTHGEQFEPTDQSALHWWSVTGTCRPCADPAVASPQDPAVPDVLVTQLPEPPTSNADVDREVVATVQDFFSDEENGRFDALAERFVADAKVHYKRRDQERTISASEYVQNARERGFSGREELLNPKVEVVNAFRAVLETDFRNTGPDAIVDGFERFALVRETVSESWRVESVYTEFRAMREKNRPNTSKIRVAIIPASQNGTTIPAFSDSVVDLRKILSGGDYREVFEIVDSGWADICVYVARGSEEQTYMTGSTTTGSTNGNVNVYGNQGSYSGTQNESTQNHYARSVTRTVVARVYWDGNDESKFQDIDGQNQGPAGPLTTWKGAAKRLGKSLLEWAILNKNRLTAESIRVPTQ